MSNEPGLERGPRRFRLSNLTSAQQFWVPLAIVLVLALAGGAIASVAGNQDVPPPVAGEGDDDGEVVAPLEEESAPDPETVFDDPGKYVGQDLSLTVVVEKVVDANTFRVVSEDPNDPSLLVVYSGVPVVKAKALITASGTITRFTPADVNKTLGAKLPVATFDLSDDDFALIASSVEVILEGGGGGRGTDTAATTTGTTAVALAPPAPTYVPPAPAYVPPPSSGTSSGGDTSSGGGSQDPSSGGSNGGSTGSEPSGGSGGGSNGGSNEPSGGANGSPTAGTDLTFTEQSATSGQYSDATYLEALLTDEEGAPISGARLTFLLDETEHVAKTNEDGIASITPTLSIEPGNYPVKVNWTRAGKTRAKDKDRFEVMQDDSVLQVALEGNGNNATLTAHLTDGDGGSAGLADRRVDFYAEDGELLGSAMTDGDGVARLEVPEKYKEQKDDFTATFEGDDYYLTSSGTSD